MHDSLAGLDNCIARYDLLCHPFYRAWDAGELTREDLRAYAADYYAHISAFPTYLSRLHARMEDGPRRRMLLRNLAGEELQGRPHSELWLDFAEEMGNDRAAVRAHVPVAEIGELIGFFRGLAETGSVAQAFAAFYAYESQVPRISEAKVRGLRDRYGASAGGYAYFALHAKADVEHARVWRQELAALAANEHAAPETMVAAEDAAHMLWQALDGVERERQVRRQA